MASEKRTYLVKSSTSFSSCAKNEIDIEFHDSNPSFSDLFEGVFLVEFEDPIDMISKIRSFIFVENAYGLILRTEICEGELDNFTKSVVREIKPHLSKESSFKIETLGYQVPVSTRDVEVCLGESLEEKGYKVDMNEPTDLIFITLHQNEAYIGVEDSKEVIPTLDLAKKFSREFDNLSRATNKLREASMRFDLDFTNRNVIDIGASPGGWSSFFLDEGSEVIAVDPAEMDSSLTSNPKMTHLKKKVQEVSVDKIEMDDVSVLACDLNVSPSDSLKIISNFTTDLREAGKIGKDFFILMTLKLRERTSSLKRVRQIKSLLDKKFKEFDSRVKHLSSNRNELTVYLH